MLEAATRALPLIDKARKWFVTRGDLDYSALWILYAADPLARMEVIGRGQLADREVIPRAMALNPETYRAETTLTVDAAIPVPDDSSAVIASEGLLGGNFVEIVPGGSFDFFNDGDEIVDTQGAVSLLNLLMAFSGQRD